MVGGWQRWPVGGTGGRKGGGRTKEHDNRKPILSQRILHLRPHTEHRGHCQRLAHGVGGGPWVYGRRKTEFSEDWEDYF
jgi:hypothetical protein